MRIQLVFILFFTSLTLFADDNSSIELLLKRYESIMDEKKIEFIDEVFTKNFIKESGGKKELIKKIIQQKNDSEIKQNYAKSQVKWKKEPKNRFYLVRLEEFKSLRGKSNEAEFIVIRENGKLKIEGTLSDGN
jgi:hypothetical protein